MNNETMRVRVRDEDIEVEVEAGARCSYTLSDLMETALSGLRKAKPGEHGLIGGPSSIAARSKRVKSAMERALDASFAGPNDGLRPAPGEVVRDDDVVMAR